MSTAIWRSKHLRGPWQRPAAPQIVGTKGEWDEDNVCVYGAALSPNGMSIGATYAGYSCKNPAIPSNIAPLVYMYRTIYF